MLAASCVPSVTSVNPHNNGDLGGIVPILCMSSLVVQLERGHWVVPGMFAERWEEGGWEEGGWEARRAT